MSEIFLLFRALAVLACRWTLVYYGITSKTPTKGESEMTSTNDANPFDFNADVIDSRDVIGRLDYLENLDRDEWEESEYQDLRALAVQCEDGGVEDWEYGALLIADRYFQTYARELADDIGAIDTNAYWPLMYIDWEAAALALQTDYTPVELKGVTYWTR